ncbi:MAG: capsule biosynthesis protein [Pseudomonadota bacterium]
MSTTLKAKKFRIRRGTTPPSGSTAADSGAEPDSDALFAGGDDDGFGDIAYPTAANPDEPVAPAKSAEEELDAIRKEGLTGRQLRMARRVALKNGLAPASDLDAVRLLRRKGIDPFQRSGVLALVQNPDGEKQARASEDGASSETHLPSTHVLNGEARARSIIEMQRDIVRRRRRRMLQLAARLAVFVLLPTLIVGWYFARVATPMYATHSEFVIQQAQAPATAGASGLSGLFSGTSFATSQDSIAVQGFLQSIDAMLRLDADLGFRTHFSGDNIDILQRLEPDATKEAAYRLYSKFITISYDPTEGIIKMEVVAADPETSRLFSERLVTYAEEKVDALSLRLREDQMQGARESFEAAEQAMFDAQQRVLALQERLGVLDPMTESQALMTQVTTLEGQLSEKRLQLEQLLDNVRPNQARVEGTRGDISRLETLIAELRAQLTVSNESGQSLARISGELRIAERELQTRELLMTQALQQMETARIEADRQTRYLEQSVSPIAPDTPAYPRAFENTLLAFLIFGGIYLMISLTASILREQMSA